MSESAHFQNLKHVNSAATSFNKILKFLKIAGISLSSDFFLIFICEFSECSLVQLTRIEIQFRSAVLYNGCTFDAEIYQENEQVFQHYKSCIRVR